MASPKIKMNTEDIERLASLQCTQVEIAAWFDASIKTLELRLSKDAALREAYDRGRAKGRISLRRHQMRMVEEGNATMAIWLGKQILGQRDVQRLEVSGPDQQPVQVESVNLHALSVGELQELYRLRAKMEAAASEAAASETAGGQVVDVKAIAGGE